MFKHISGFPEFSPEEQIIFNDCVSKIKNLYETYGFAPLDTAAVEKVSTLLSKGNDHEIYGIHRLGDDGNAKKDMALRFDLTVPTARYVANNAGQLTFPYKRYQIAPVWRGERAQAGRYRQFYQCDVDIIGDGQLDLHYDIEVVSIIPKALSSIGVTNITVKLNNRKVISGFLESIHIDAKNHACVIRIIDKLDKISKDEMAAELLNENLDSKQVDAILSFLHQKLDNNGWITHLKTLQTNPTLTDGISELETVYRGLNNILGAASNCIQITPSLARGLAYYTGTVCETIHNDFPELGSISGGGRYANLVSGLSKRALPGVGISIGISRLLPKLLETNHFILARKSTAQLMIANANCEYLNEYFTFANAFREKNIRVFQFLDQKKIGQQLTFADKLGIRYVLIFDEYEADEDVFIIKDLKEGKQHKFSVNNLNEAVEMLV